MSSSVSILAILLLPSTLNDAPGNSFCLVSKWARRLSPVDIRTRNEKKKGKIHSEKAEEEEEKTPCGEEKLKREI